MERTKRRWLILGIGLCVALVLALRWAKFSHDAERRTHPAPLDSAHVTAPSPAPAQSPSENTAAIVPSPAIEGGGVLRGRAFDAATRKPVEAFEVQLQPAEAPWREKPISRSFRAPGGRFEWKTAPPGTWRVAIEARGYQRFELDELRVAKGESGPEIIAPLIRGQRIAGRVFDQATGAPIGSARITWREAHLSFVDALRRLPGGTTSKPDGSFELDAVASGRVTVMVSASEYAPRELDVVTDAETPRVEIGLGRGAVIAGQLTNADGSAIAGFVMLGNADSHTGSGIPTSASGEFSFPRLPPGRYRISGRAGGAITRSLEVVLAENERLDSVTLALMDGRSVRGVVRGVRPERLHAVRVHLRTSDEEGFFDSQLDENGSFALHGVPAGRAQLTVQVLNDTRSIQLVDVPASSDLTLTIDISGGFRLSGHITERGIPRANRHIWAHPTRHSPTSAIYSAHTSKEGAYEMEGVLAGEYEVRAQGDIMRRIRISGDTVLDIELPSTQMAGRLLEESGSVPIVGGGIHVIGTKSDAPIVRVYKETDHSGQFSLVGLEPSELLLSAYKPGYEMFRERVTYGAPVSDMTIRLRRSPGVELSVIDAQSGRGIRELYLMEKIGVVDGISLRVRLDERGFGSLPSAFAGSTLTFSAQGYFPETIREWNAQQIELRLLCVRFAPASQ